MTARAKAPAPLPDVWALFVEALERAVEVGTTADGRDAVGLVVDGMAEVARRVVPSPVVPQVPSC